ncbi:response regulator transcription factor [Cryobacterium sp. SO1]|uniref:response regulator transcription factor n=1 Tax=Cryobacterium sp. SO1 TaxID=1897061 RepID=UPI0010DC86BD|nr:Alkaline phosphatase synthesis transcriptional regulatory protein PhoP [Cryobacterium sp. SO1]
MIIEDDADIRHLLEAVLTQAGFDAIATSNGLDGVRAVRAYDPIVTTLDVSMPGMDGFETAKRIRAFSATYLVMLTARDEEIDTLQGLEAGADDYLTKPFRPRELRARIDAMLRRPRLALPPDGTEQEPVATVAPVAYAPAAPVAAEPAFTPAYVPPVMAPAPPAADLPPSLAPVSVPGTHTGAHAAPVAQATSAASASSDERADDWLEHNGLRLSNDMRLAMLGTVELDLTRTEFDLLAALLESKRRVRSKADLALLLRGESYVTSYYVNEADKRAVEAHLSNLRRKLGDSLTSPRWLETVRGVGYRLAASDEAGRDTF